MAEETVVAEPAAEESGFDLNNMGAAFDAAFPSTAPKPGAEPAPEPVQPITEPVVTPAPAPGAAAAPPVATTDDGLPPDDVFGDKPTPAPAPPKEYDAPESIKKDAKVYKNWNEVRHAEAEATAKAAKLEVENAQLREKAEKPATDEGLVARVAELEAVNRELSERSATIDLQSSLEFQRTFTLPRQKFINSALEVAKEAGVEPKDVERALDLNGRAKTEALDEIVRGIDSPTLQAELGAIVKDINTLDRNRAAALADSKGNLERLRQHNKAQEYQQLQEHVKFIDKSLSEMADYIGNLTDKDGNYKGCVYFRKLENNPEWSKKVDGYVQRAKETATNSKDERQLLSKLMMGEAMPDIYDDLIRTRKALQKERAINAENKAADPSLNGSRGTETTDPPLDKNLSFAESAARGSGLP